MSKRRNNDALKDNTQPTAKRVRNPPGFRVARPPSTAASSSTNSRITALVVGSNGRLAGKRKDRSHPILPANINPTTTDLPEDTNYGTDLPEDAFQASSTDVPTEPKPKRKRNNDTQVCDFFTDHYFPDWLQFISKSKLQEWLSFRDTTLDEVLRHDGLGDYLGQLGCSTCNIGPGLFKCKDCSGGSRLRCQNCIVKSHQDIPLHRIEVRFFSIDYGRGCKLIASYCSDGPANISTMIPSKILVSAYNSDTGGVSVRVHPLGLPDSWFLIPPASMLWM